MAVCFLVLRGALCGCCFRGVGVDVSCVSSVCLRMRGGRSVYVGVCVFFFMCVPRGSFVQYVFSFLVCCMLVLSPVHLVTRRVVCLSFSHSRSVCCSDFRLTV